MVHLSNKHAWHIIKLWFVVENFRKRRKCACLLRQYWNSLCIHIDENVICKFKKEDPDGNVSLLTTCKTFPSKKETTTIKYILYVVDFHNFFTPLKTRCKQLGMLFYDFNWYISRKTRGGVPQCLREILVKKCIWCFDKAGSFAKINNWWEYETSTFMI